MKNSNDLIISKTDFEKITAILNMATKKQAELLEEELARAIIVADDKLPEDVVAMNSLVNFEDLDSGKLSTVMVVYPVDANLEANKVSIIAPVGAALIGLSVGQCIQWPINENKIRRIKVLAVKRKEI